MSWIAAGIAAAGLAAKIGSTYAKGGAKRALDIGGTGALAGGTMGLGGAGFAPSAASGATAAAGAATQPTAQAPQVAMQPRNMVNPPTGTQDDDTVAERFNDIYKRDLDEEMYRQRNPIRTYSLYD